jgi:predicted house-cleaning NTP pyrophosphatase (Maf/HAM1 superfamily)
MSTSIKSNPLQKNGLPSPLILGSQSSSRQSILKELNIPYQSIVRPIDEYSIGSRTTGSDPYKLVHLLANAKMDSLMSYIAIITHDQFPKQFEASPVKDGLF